MTLRSFLLRSLAYTVLLVFMIIIVNWLIFEGIPGQNGAQAFLSGSPRIAANPLAKERICALWQCHASRTDQFVAYIHAFLTSQFGYSYQTSPPVPPQFITH